MDHRCIRSSSRISGSDCQNISSFLLEVQGLSDGDKSSAVLGGDGETTACVAASDFVVKPKI